MSKIIFETKNFYLREFQEQDLDLLFDLWNCPKILTSVDSKPLNKTQIKEKLKRYQNWMKNHNFTNLAVFQKNSNNFIGSCGFSIFHDPENNRNPLKLKEKQPEIGYILKKEYWNKGFASELVQESINYFFKNFKEIKNIIAVTTINNKISQKILLKNGFQFIKEIETKEYGKENFYLLEKSNFENQIILN